eukprot:274582-Prymnesium_polylepis.1
MPPLIPGPAGFTTVSTMAQLRAAIDGAWSNDSVRLFLPPRSTLYVDDVITIRRIDVQLISTGEGAVLNGQYRNSFFEVVWGARLWLHSLTLTNGGSGRPSDGAGGAIHIERNSQ